MTQCSRCIMDQTDPDITFNEDGICNHCLRYDDLAENRLINESARAEQLDALVNEIKVAGQVKKYDCIIGISGGVDSTYVAWLVREKGLRPLAVHLDNGWNSELAVSNIQKTLELLGIDLYTHVIDWEEFKDLQLSFLKASTPDGEVPTDHAIFALLYSIAAKYGLKHVITGTNVATEAILPEKWGYGYFDWRYVKAIHRKFGRTKLKTYPCLPLPRFFYYVFIRRIRLVSILNYIEYDKEQAMDVLENQLGWVYYGGKHYESIYTRFYQSFYLVKKFNIDKRKAHYSNLICSKQMDKEQAIELMKLPPIEKEAESEDFEYVAKKFRLSTEELLGLIDLENKYFDEYPNSKSIFEFAKKLVNKTRKFIG